MSEFSEALNQIEEKYFSIRDVQQKEDILRNVLNSGMFSSDQLEILKRKIFIVRHLSLQHMIDKKLEHTQFKASDEWAKSQSKLVVLAEILLATQLEQPPE